MKKYLPLIAAPLLIGLLSWYFIYKTGSNDILVSEAGAQWIRSEYPLSAVAQPVKDRTASFTTKFELGRVPPRASLRLKTFRKALLSINSKTVQIPTSEFPFWKVSRELDISPWLLIGQNKITIEVTNSRGPPAVLAYSHELGVRTNRQWMASRDNGVAMQAVTVSVRPNLEQYDHFPTSLQALSREFVFLFTFFVVGSLTYLWVKAKNVNVSAGQVRWAMLAAWVVLGANNIFKIPIYFGMDVNAHYNYIIHILNFGSLPLATDGWATFHPPFFYVVEALLAIISSFVLSRENALFFLRVIPLACGLAQIELAYRSCCLIFKKRSDLQIVGTVIGGFLPMSFYVSQFVSNEPFAASLTAVLIYYCFYYLINGFGNDAIKSSAILAVCFSASLLSKVSVLLLLPITLAVITFVTYRPQKKLQLAVKPLAVFLLITVLLTGWYFFRNLYHFGQPFLSPFIAWELLGFEWWQAPGYLTLTNLLTFGRALNQPIYSSMFGFWDALYSSFWLDGNLSGETKGSPPWNLEFMNTLSVLSLPIALLMFYGAFHGLKSKRGEQKLVVIFVIGCIVTFVAAIFHMYTQLSVYSTVKATYMLGLTPCFSVLAALAYESLPKGGWWPATACGYLTCWAVTAYISFFVLRGAVLPM